MVYWLVSGHHRHTEGKERKQQHQQLLGMVISEILEMVHHVSAYHRPHSLQLCMDVQMWRQDQ